LVILEVLEVEVEEIRNSLGVLEVESRSRNYTLLFDVRVVWNIDAKGQSIATTFCNCNGNVYNCCIVIIMHKFITYVCRIVKLSDY